MGSQEMNEASNGRYHMLNPLHNPLLKNAQETVLEVGADTFRKQLLRSIWKRLSPQKPQFASITWLLAIALNPCFK
jgi:hypothetical protein